MLGGLLEIPVERVPEHESLRLAWWRCPTCAAPAGGLARVPLVTVVSRVRPCPSCGAVESHPFRPLVLSVVSGVVIGAFAARFGATPALAAYGVLALGLVAITAIDIEHRIVPIRVLYPTLGLMSVLLVVASTLDGRFGALGHAAVAGVGAFGLFLAIHLAQPGGMGFGDVRLAGLVGVATGWLGPGWRGIEIAAAAIMVAFVLGALVGTALMVVKGYGRKSKVPFAPFLAAGAVVALLWGNAIVHLWLGRLG